MDVKHLCLGVLSMDDASGYDIKKFFEKSFANFFVAGYGSIYPALADLLDNGQVTCREEHQDKLPDKKIYSITAIGRQAFEKALLRTKPRHKIRSEFLVLMFFAHLLPPEKVAQHLRARIEELELLLTHIAEHAEENHSQHPGLEFTIGYGKATTEATRDYIADAGQRLVQRLERAERETDSNVIEIKRA